jgi:hypothetical protein
MKRRGLVSLLLGALLATAHARAEPAKRKLPDYDGRGGPRQTPGQKALWIPRIVLSPLYFVSEYLLRRPLGFAITAAEKAELPSALYDFFAFGPDHKAGIVPIGFVDFGFRPSVGLYGFWDDAGFKGHQLRLHGTTGGAGWLSGTATERFVFSERFDFTLSGTLTRRPDYAFYGIGPDTHEDDLMRYSGDSATALGETRVRLWGSSVLEATAGYRGVSYGHSNYHDAHRGEPDYQPSVDDEVAAGRVAAPPGFETGYRAVFGRSRLVLDSRPKSGSLSGGRLDLSAEEGVDLKNSPGAHWLRYGATLGGFVDLGDSGRVISLSVAALLADPLGDRPVPLTELVTLGGPNLMPGFRAGRLYDRSAMVATLRYSWPIWIWLNGSLQVAAGNVFGEHFDGFRVERGRLSSAIGIESGDSRDSVFQALLGFGTETFESGAKVDSLRIVVGARRGF